jgi:hypothetical protein
MGCLAWWFGGSINLRILVAIEQPGYLVIDSQGKGETNKDGKWDCLHRKNEAFHAKHVQRNVDRKGHGAGSDE